MTEDELRAALRSATSSTPGTPGLAQRAEHQGRRQQAGIRAAGAAALVAVVVAGAAIVALPRTTATPTPPATGSPTASESVTAGDGTITTTSTVGSLESRVVGPEAVAGAAPFALTVTVTNTAGTAWSGKVAVGVLYDQRVPGYFDGDLLTTADGVEGYTQFGAALPSALTRSAFGGVETSDEQTLGAGETRTWTFQVRRVLSIPDDGNAKGWIAMLTTKGGDPSDGLDARRGTRVTFTPAESNLPCATVGVVGNRGVVGPWGLEYVATATVGADRKATWEEVPGVDGEGGATFTSTRSGDVLASVVIQQLGEQGFPASGYGAGRPELEDSAAPGAYVAYSAVRMVDVDFAGTCGENGPISGTWRAYDSDASGIYDCATPAESGAERKAAAYCPKP